MDAIEITITTLTCKRCGHTWKPRTENLPSDCPKCKSPYWNKDRIIRNKKS